VANKRRVRSGHRAEMLDFSRLFDVAPRAELPEALPDTKGAADASRQPLLDVPLTIREVAELIGCSVWTVRQRCIPQGLPYFRASPTGKLIFYRNRVNSWLIEKQKGRR
jgi:hypothetical protein